MSRKVETVKEGRGEIHKVLRERAELRVKEDLDEFVKAVSRTVIGRKLGVDVGLKFSSGVVDYQPLVNSHGYTGGTLFNSDSFTKYATELTNIKLVEEELIKEYYIKDLEGLLIQVEAIRNLK